jgi:penicillin amidase/acyl-homoserine-lactone acylase
VYQKLLAGSVSLVLLLLAFTQWRDAAKRRQLIADASGYDARILRDTWGIPHIFGKSDADAAYGLAYAHCEDDFDTLQELLLMTRGLLASVHGKSEAPVDYLVQLFRIKDLVDEKYLKDLSPEIRAVCEGYASGINHYAALHPKKAITRLLPVTGKDIVEGFVFRGPFFYGLDGRVKELFGDKRERKISTKKTALHSLGDRIRRGLPLGSNAFAVAPKRTPDGKTHLAINSHQPWEGPVAWYEAHVHSDQGWDAVGGLFPGSPVVLLGHNRDLGWAHTVNSPDLVDIYVLDINPDNPNQYKLDGRWRDFDVREARIRVRLWGPFFWTVKREILWCEYGPAVRQPHGVYAIRNAGHGDIRQVEQWYRMNKARNFEEFKRAMEMRAIPSLNCVYADRQGNTFYLYNAFLPMRAEGYDWREYLPGDTSETLWTQYLPFERLPQVLNPASGFVMSCNNTPFRTTSGEGNPDPASYSPVLGIETHVTNRGLRALELFGSDDSITEEELAAYKFDDSYSQESDVAKAAQDLISAPTSEDPLIREGTNLIRKWDLRTNKENTTAAIALMTIQPDPDGGHRGGGVEQMRERMRRYGRILQEKHGRLDPPWGEVNRLVRGKEDLPLGGGPDVLRGIYSLFERDGTLFGFEDDGRVEGKGGDSSMLLVSWDKEGQVRSRAVHQFGSATLDPGSPHYSDQAPLFANQEFRPVWMDEREIRDHLEREYHPGE